VTGMANETGELRSFVSLGSRSMRNTVYDVVAGIQFAGRPTDASGSQVNESRSRNTSGAAHAFDQMSKNIRPVGLTVHATISIEGTADHWIAGGQC
jgi:hypothetical protein